MTVTVGPIEGNVVISAAEVGTWLDIAPPPDIVNGIYAMMLTSAKQLADQYCNNPFLDEDDLVVIPTAVKNGVLQILTEINASWQQAKGGGTTSGSIIKEKVGDVEVQYDKSSVTSGMGDLSAFAKSLLDIYRLMPL